MPIWLGVLAAGVALEALVERRRVRLAAFLASLPHLAHEEAF